MTTEGKTPYTIYIDDQAIVEQVNGIIDSVYQRELKSKYSETGHMLAAAIKELVYSHKDEIVERVVTQAAKEIARKALPKLLERMEE